MKGCNALGYRRGPHARTGSRCPWWRRASKGIRALLAVLFAVGGAAACDETETAPVAAPLLLESGASSMMTGVQYTVTDNGVNQGEVFADTAFLYDDSTTYTLRNPVLTLFTENGVQRARVTAERGRMDLTTNALNARGNVVLTIVDGNRRVESQELNYDPARDQIWSDSFTVMHEEGAVFQGMGFRSDLEFRQVRVGPGSIRRTGPGGGGAS